MALQMRHKGFSGLRALAISVAGVVLSALSASAWAGDHKETSLEDFIVTYRCMVIEHLKAIREHGSRATPENRYVILALQNSPQRFVQCIYHEYDSKLLCEASSGRFGPRAGQHHNLTLSQHAIERLHALGFEDPPGDDVANFAQEIALGDPPDLESVSRILLSAMYETYGARNGMIMKLTTPLVAPEPEIVLGCKPVS